MKLFKAQIILTIIGLNTLMPTILTAQDIAIKLNPEKVYLIKSNNQQFVNCDFYLESTHKDTLHLTKLEIRLFDDNGRLLMQKYVTSKGISPSILTIPDRKLIKDKTLLVFNPFHTFDADIPVASFEFKFTLTKSDGSASFEEKISVVPNNAKTKTKLIFPIQNVATLIRDGNDFYAHHRRFDLSSFPVQMFNITKHGNRYSYDFCPVNTDGELFKNNGESVEDWFGFGTDIVATADGTIVEMYNNAIDNKIGEIDFDYREAATNHTLIYGNYIIIDHQNGEFSGYMHLKKGSVKLKVGDKVKQGDIIAQLGNSGDSFSPHLHYQLNNATTLPNSDGIPIYFSDYQRVFGKKQIDVEKGYMDTGEIVRAKNIQK